MMYHFSGWTFSLILLGLLIIPVTGFLIYYFRDYVVIYRSPRVMIAIAIPFIIIGEYHLWNLVINDLSGQAIVRWPQIPTILMIIVYLILFGIFCTFASVFGDAWIMHWQYRKVTFLGPYLMYGPDPHTSIRIGWITPKNNEDKNIIQIQPQFASIQFKRRQFDPTQYKMKTDVQWLEITGLEPGLQYEYWFTSSELTAKKFKFKLPEMTQKDTHDGFSFIAIGDLHASEHKIHKEIQLIQKHHSDVPFWLTLGDIITEAQDPFQWRTWFLQAVDLLPFTPIFYTIGNHEGFSPLRIQYWKTFFWPPFANETQGCYYSTNYQNVHFVFLDNYDNRSQFYRFSDTQVQWIHSDLQSAQAKDGIDHIIISMHHPPFSTGDSGCDPVLGKIFNDIIEKYGKIRFVLAGHCHFYQSFVVTRKKSPTSQVGFIISGGAAKRMESEVTKKHRIHYRPYNWSSHGLNQKVNFTASRINSNILRNDTFVNQFHHLSIIIPHFLRFSIKGNAIDMQVYDWNNKILDQLTISK